MKVSRDVRSAIGVFLLVIGVALIGNWTPVASLFREGGVGVILAVALILIASYFLARKKLTILPVFLWALLFGMALQGPLYELTHSGQAFTVLVDLMLAFILFGSGLLVPVRGFKKHFGSIATLSVLGSLVTIGLFAIALTLLVGLFGIPVPFISLVVLAAILASIDPTALDQPLQHLHLKRPFLKDIALSEGALNDAVGVVIARFVLIAALGVGTAYATLPASSAVSFLLSEVMLAQLTLEIIWGFLVGLLGYAILKVWGESVRNELHWSDPALFAVVPLFAFALGSIVGGAGFVAAFVAGLLYDAQAATHAVREKFDQSVTDILKPALFLLLGALAPLELLVDVLPLGLAVALIFMFVIRPLVVFITLLPWYRGRGYLSWRDALFLSTMRETGGLSAGLLILALTLGLLGASFVYAIGVWVIIFTLIIEPPITIALAERLNLTK